MNALTIPNILTLGRMVLTVFFFSAGLQNDWPWALTLFVAAAVTDMIDGTVARLLNQKSRFGAIIDPAADKIMMLAGVSLLTIQDVLPWWLMAIIVGRDLYIVLGLFYMWSRSANARLSPSIVSKLTTLAQILTISFGFAVATRDTGFQLPQIILFFADLLPWAIIAASVLTIASGIHYTAVGLRVLRRQVEKQESEEEI